LADEEASCRPDPRKFPLSDSWQAREVRMTQGIRRSGHGGAFVGLMLLLLGGIMLLHEQEVFHLGSAWRLWPLFMIVVGLHSMIEMGRQKLLHNLIVVGIGILFLAINFHLWGLRMRHFAPLVVLIVGASFVLDAFLGRRGRDDASINGGVS
jgi:hypothetical protein